MHDVIMRYYSVKTSLQCICNAKITLCFEYVSIHFKFLRGNTITCLNKRACVTIDKKTVPHTWSNHDYERKNDVIYLR